MANDQGYQELLESIVDFISGHRDPAFGRFKDGIIGWGSQQTNMEQVKLPVSDYLEEALSMAVPETRSLLSRFCECRQILHWEQTYRKQDNVVSDDMLADYGFAEIIGKNGPFVSSRVRCGIGVWGPDITYPLHHHKSEEIYHVLAGSAVFTVSGKKNRRNPGESVFVESDAVHGFSTDEHPVVVFYIWQGGDLRQISTFDSSVI